MEQLEGISVCHPQKARKVHVTDYSDYSMETKPSFLRWRLKWNSYGHKCGVVYTCWLQNCKDLPTISSQKLILELKLILSLFCPHAVRQD